MQQALSVAAGGVANICHMLPASEMQQMGKRYGFHASLQLPIRLIGITGVLTSSSGLASVPS